MKRSVTGDEADGCCPQRKSPCPTLVGRKTNALSIKADSDGVRFNAKYTFCLIWLLCTRYYSKKVQTLLLKKCPKKVIRDTCPSITYYFAKYYVILCKVS